MTGAPLGPGAQPGTRPAERTDASAGGASAGLGAGATRGATGAGIGSGGGMGGAAGGAASGTLGGAPALAEALAAQLQRWALLRGAEPAAAGAALVLAGQAGHVCLPLQALAEWLPQGPVAGGAGEGAGESSGAGPGEGSSGRSGPLVPGAPDALPLAAPTASALPADAPAWQRLLVASPVVAPASAPGNCPLVLDAEGRLYLHRAFDLERRLARRLLQATAPLEPVATGAQAAAVAQLRTLFPQAAGPAPDWQALAAALALRSRLTVVSGGPGTGKTTTVVQLLACVLAQAPGTRIVLAAPTGKAAARLVEAVQQRAATLTPALRALLPSQASTVHRLLGVRSGPGGAPRGGDAGFQHHAGNPLPLDLLVLDEASMLDLALATRLLEAVPASARIVLLGDKDQLAAVESGAVFAELSTDPRLSPAAVQALAGITGSPATAIQPPAAAAAAAAPLLPDTVVWLTHSWRFAAGSGIGRLAVATREGDAQALLDTLAAVRETTALAPSPASPAGPTSPTSPTNPTNPTSPTSPPPGGLRWLDDAAAQPAPATLAACLAGYAAYLQACQAALAAPGSQPAIQAALQALQGFRVLCAVREGPRGVQGINTALSAALRQALAPAAPGSPWFAGRPVMVQRNDPALRLFNGDIGITLPDAEGSLQLWFGTADGGVRAVAPARLPQHDTAWAMTVHKSQGSEFDHVLLLLPAQPSRVLSRALLYTGITRARAALTLAAPAAVLQQAVRSAHPRHAGLGARLRELAAPAAPAGQAGREG